MKYLVKSWSKSEDLYLLQSEDGKLLRVDLFVSDSFINREQMGLSIEDANKNIIGKYVELEDLDPYAFIANGVKFV